MNRLTRPAVLGVAPDHRRQHHCYDECDDRQDLVVVDLVLNNSSSCRADGHRKVAGEIVGFGGAPVRDQS